VGLKIAQEVAEVLANASPCLDCSRNNMQTTGGWVTLEFVSFRMLARHTIHRGGLGVLASLLWMSDSGIDEEGWGAWSGGDDVHDCLFSCGRAWGRASARGGSWLEASPGRNVHLTCWLVVGIPEDATECQND
jgi:hypothetical protein